MNEMSSFISNLLAYFIFEGGYISNYRVCALLFVLFFPLLSFWAIIWFWDRIDVILVYEGLCCLSSCLYLQIYATVLCIPNELFSTKLKTLSCRRMFYFFFESRNSKEDPVVIWLTGGPGCSSELALFYENGPFSITNNLSLAWNEYGWDKVNIYLFTLHIIWDLWH